jgi:flagellar hook protein FlgE
VSPAIFAGARLNLPGNSRSWRWHHASLPQHSIGTIPAEAVSALLARSEDYAMSLFGALTTALSGLGSLSAALGNISDNIANSQTVGFKRVDTSFMDYITTSSGTTNEPGAVVAQPDYANSVQGTITQSDSPLSLAISGQGFFSVSKNISSSATAPTFGVQQYFTRAGDFSMNSDGYLVNGADNYLNGWPVLPDGSLDTNTFSPIQISQSIYKPVSTANVTLSANLPPNTSGSAAALPQVTSNVSVYDAQGEAHLLSLNFTSTGLSTNAWNVAVTDDKGNTLGSGALGFGADGTLGFVTQGGATQSTSGSPGSFKLTTVYPSTSASGTQTITLNLGTIGSTDGVTQFAGPGYSLRGISQDGVPPGSFSSVTTTTSGDVVVNYDNGQSRRIARVPAVTFAAPDALQRQSGSAFTATTGSGSPLAQNAGNNGAGAIVTRSVEQSNVDIATEFSQLIVAQQAYSANAKLVTTASDMMQTTLDMKH